ncbi:MAG: site-specific integrase [Clostridiales bacterium]|nr:site-specific integrase [Clostridiales bacterium]
MAAKWMKSRFPGVRYREHESRRYGVKFDRYYSVRYKLNGKDKEEALGWASQGWTEQKAVECLAELKQNHRTGEGAQTIKEKREKAEAQRQAEIEVAEQEKRDNMTFADVWKEYHGKQPEGKALEDQRKQKKFDREDQLYRLWIAPVISEMKIRLISPVNLKRIEKNMEDAGKAPRSIQYAFALIRQVYNFAKKNDLFSGDIPTSKIKWPKVDNGRARYLTPDEANTLLQALKEKSQDTYGISLLSFQCGLRFGEVAHLRWSDVDYERGLLLIRDAKAGTRHAFLTEQVAEMLKNRIQGEPYNLIFPAKNGGVMPRISPTFHRVVKELGLNKGIDDRRQKLVFHSARHSFGSLLAEQGQDLYTIQKLIGHKTVTMTQRYSHLTENKLRNAVESLGKAFEKNRDNVIGFQEDLEDKLK